MTGYKTAVGGADTVFPFKNHRIYVDKVSITGPNGYGGTTCLYFDVTDYKTLKINSMYNNSSSNGHAGGGNNTNVIVYGYDNNNYLNPETICNYGKIITGGKEQTIPDDFDISACKCIKIQVSAIPSGSAEGGIKGVEII